MQWMYVSRVMKLATNTRRDRSSRSTRRAGLRDWGWRWQYRRLVVVLIDEQSSQV